MRPQNARGPLAGVVMFVMIVLLASFPGARATILQVSVLILLAIAMSELASRALPRPAKRQWLLDGSLRENPSDAHRPNDLVELEHALGWGSYGPREFRNRVQPILRELMVDRLAPGAAVPAALKPVAADDANVPPRTDTNDISMLVDEIEAL